MACPCELFSSWMPQSNPGPAFWCSCPRLNVDRTLPPPPTPEQDTTPGRGQESLRAPASVTHTPSQPGRVVAEQGPGCGWRREYLQERVLCPLPPERASPCPHPATQLERGSTQGTPPALHPSRAFASLPIRPGAACCPRARSLAWGAHPGGYTARVFPGQSWSLASLWPRSPLEASGPGRQGQTEASPSLAQGQTGQWVSYAARQQGHTSPPLPGLLKIAPPQSSVLAPAARMLFFRAGPPCSWCFVFSKRFPWQPGPPALQNGEGSSCHRHSHRLRGAC